MSYTGYDELDIHITPHSILHVFMVYKPLNELIKIEELEIESFERIGVTVVEWGGTKVN